MPNPVERAIHFLQIDRHDLAEKELRQLLVQQPDDPLAKALLSRALSGQQQHREARTLAEEAVTAAPDHSFTHSALAHARSEQNDPDGALESIEEALRLDPDDADLWASKASFYCAKEQWEEALQAARQGQSLEPENAGCANLAGMCLQMLGRKDEAAAVTEQTLSRDPDSAFAHANRGWVHLRQNEYREAEEHFRESLRLKPGNEWAREGVIRAIKARNPVYRGLLQFWLWLGTKTAGIRVMVVIGLVVGRRILRGIGEQYPALQPLMMFLGALLLIFVLLTWIGDPLFNLTLRFHPLGRLALTKRERWTANVVGLMLLVGLGALALPLVGAAPVTMLIGLCVVSFTIPLANCLENPENRKVLIVTALLGAAGLGALASHLAGNADLANSMVVAYTLGILAFTWLYGALSRS